MPLIPDVFQRPWLGRPAPLALDVAPRPPRRTADGRLIGSAIRPSAGVRAHYDARLKRLVDEMHASVAYWLRAAYRRQGDRISALAGDAAYIRGEDEADSVRASPPPRTIPPGSAGVPPPASSSPAMDARPSTELEETIRRLRYRWLRRFDEASQDLAQYFAQAVWQRSDAELKRILKRAGFAVEFKVSQPVRDALAAIVAENVALIKSIPQQYLGQVEGSVLRSVVAGRDLKTLADELEHHYGVTRQRAELIATHQNQSATGAIQRLQYLEVGIERAIWRHSHAGKEPRPSHVANDGKEYDVRTGWWDPHERKYIRTGELIHCRCFSQPVMPR